MGLFRERLLARLIEKHAISQELATKLMAWRHPGFSAHVGEPISADDTQALENLAGRDRRLLIGVPGGALSWRPAERPNLSPGAGWRGSCGQLAHDPGER